MPHRLIPESQYHMPAFPVVAFYGLNGRLRQLFRDYQSRSIPFVYVDLGYWCRRLAGRFDGYHKVVVSGRHPTRYFQSVRHDDARRLHLERRNIDLTPRPWHKGDAVLVAGMGDKAATYEGYAPGQWEEATIARLRTITDRPVVYRPKPSWATARPIEGSIYSPRDEPLDAVLARCHIVVTHHSNVAVDAILAGVPVYAEDGVARPMGIADLIAVGHPCYPTDHERRQFVDDLTYTQWSVAEIADGLAWRHLTEEGLITP